MFLSMHAYVLGVDKSPHTTTLIGILIFSLLKLTDRIVQYKACFVGSFEFSLVIYYVP